MKGVSQFSGALVGVAQKVYAFVNASYLHMLISLFI